jgi:hypothetical protein
MSMLMRNVKFPKFKITLDKANSVLVFDGISKKSMAKINSSITISEKLIDEDDPEWLLSPYKYITIELEGSAILNALFALAKEYENYIPRGER